MVGVDTWDWCMLMMVRTGRWWEGHVDGGLLWLVARCSDSSLSFASEWSARRIERYYSFGLEWRRRATSPGSVHPPPIAWGTHRESELSRTSCSSSTATPVDTADIVAPFRSRTNRNEMKLRTLSSFQPWRKNQTFVYKLILLTARMVGLLYTRAIARLLTWLWPRISCVMSERVEKMLHWLSWNVACPLHNSSARPACHERIYGWVLVSDETTIGVAEQNLIRSYLDG